MRDIEELREDIDQVDRELVRLFNIRLTVAGEVAEYKRAHDLPVLDEAREQALLKKVAALSDAEYREETLELYEQILTISKDHQTKILQNG